MWVFATGPPTLTLHHPNRMWMLAAETDGDCLSWMRVVDELCQGHQVYSGYLTKRGEKFHTWRRRFFILFSRKVLNYYYDHTDLRNGLVGQIDLKRAMWLRIWRELLNSLWKSPPNYGHFGTHEYFVR